MEIQRIEKLINEWEKATDKVIEFENPGYEKVRELFKETFEVLHKTATASRLSRMSDKEPKYALKPHF